MPGMPGPDQPLAAPKLAVIASRQPLAAGTEPLAVIDVPQLLAATRKKDMGMVRQPHRSAIFAVVMMVVGLGDFLNIL